MSGSPERRTGRAGAALLVAAALASSACVASGGDIVVVGPPPRRDAPSTTIAPSTSTSTAAAATTSAPPVAATSAPTTVSPPTPAPVAAPVAGTSCRAVVHIGDSTSVGMVSASYVSDPAARLDAQFARVGVVDRRLEISGARSIVETLDGQVNARDVAAQLVAGGFNGCWVLALGTTDTANVHVGSDVGRTERIDRMMAVIGDQPVLWVNVKTLVSSGAWSNDAMVQWDLALVEAAGRYPNLHLYDWAGAAQDGWFSRDRIHYTSEGFAQRARLIADALAAAFPA